METTEINLTSQLERASTLDENKSRHAITIYKKTPDEVYVFWRNFSNLATFMKDVKKVEMLSDTLSRWTIELHSGRSISWEAEITEEDQGRIISWASVRGSKVKTTGWVSFEKAQGDRGTVVRLSMDYSVPGGKLTEWTTFMTGESPDLLAITNLRRLKALLETGEIPTTEGQPTGKDEEESTPVVTH